MVNCTYCTCKARSNVEEMAMGFIIDNSAVESLYAFLLLFWLVYLYFVNDFGHWEELQVVQVPPIFPLGSLPKLVLGKHSWAEAFTKVYNRFPLDRYVGFFYVREPCLLLRDPSLIKRVLETDFDSFTDRVLIRVSPKDYLAHNMYNMAGPEWMRMRARMKPAYAVAKMEVMFFLVKSSSESLLRTIDQLPGDVKEIDTEDLLSRFMIGTIATCALGDDIMKAMKKKNCEFYEFVKKMCFTCSRLLKIVVLKSFPMFAKYHFFDFFDLEVKNFFSTTIVNAIEYREKNKIDRCDFLGLMMKMRQNPNVQEEGESTHSNGHFDTDKEGLTVEEITAEMHLFILMGHESTSDTCLFCLYELACHKDLQERIYTEVKAVLSHHVSLTFQALQQMTLMDQVINEVMRLYPVFSVLMRNCTQTYKVPDSSLVIKKGMGVYIPVSALHRDPNYFPDPDKFDPDRFSPANFKNVPPFVFLPFGAGPRTCMGFRFGLMLMKSALASIVSRYVVDLAPGTQVPLAFRKTAFVTAPEKPLKLLLTPRSKT